MERTIFTTLTEDDFRLIIKDSIKEEMAMYFSSETANRPAYDMLTMKELCTQLKVTKPTIISWTKKGILKGHRIGRRVFYKKEDVEKSFKEYRGTVAQEMHLLNAVKNWKGNTF